MNRTVGLVVLLVVLCIGSVAAAIIWWRRRNKAEDADNELPSDIEIKIEIKEEATGLPPLMPKWMISFPIAYLICLLIALPFWRPINILFNTITFNGTEIVPFSVLWMGMLGGVVISLQGIFFHNQSWKGAYDNWHMFSGLIGAIYGLVSYLFLVAVVKAPAADNAAFFALAAFVLGYGQKQFDSLMNEIFDLIFHPHKDKDEKDKDPKVH
jgi:hypothetical protein